MNSKQRQQKKMWEEYFLKRTSGKELLERNLTEKSWIETLETSQYFKRSYIWSWKETEMELYMGLTGGMELRWNGSDSKLWRELKGINWGLGGSCKERFYIMKLKIVVKVYKVIQVCKVTMNELNWGRSEKKLWWKT